MECFKCKNTMTKATLITYAGIFELWKIPLKYFLNKKCDIFTYVCSNCGYIEFYAEKPRIFED